MEVGIFFFSLHCFNQPGSTLSLLHVNHWPHPPRCTWIELGQPLRGAAGGGGGVWGLCVKVVDYVLFSPLLLDVAAALRMGATPHAAGLSRVERSPVTKHRELPTISVSKSGSTSSKSDATNVTPKSDTHLSPHKSSSTHEVQASLHSIHIHICMYRSRYL